MTEKCAHCAGRAYDAELQHIAPSARHCRLLESYLMNLDRGVEVVHAMIAEDLRRFAELGAMRYVSDLEFVRDCFVEEFAARRRKTTEAAA